MTENLTLEEMQAQIKALQQAMDEKLAEEIPKAKEQILEIADKYGIKVSFEGEPKRREKKEPPKAKYRLPTGEEWSGRGRIKNAFKKAIDEGAKLEDFLIEKETQETLLD